MYDHHGVYVGNNEVVHYSGDRAKDVSSARVRLSTLDEFADGHAVQTVSYGISLPPIEVVMRAFELLGEARYNLVLRNCEHLATLAKVGVSFSHQVERLLATCGTPLVAQIAATFLAAETAVNLAGAAKTMQALTAAGRMVGGGPLVGIGLTSATVGAVSLTVLFLAYRDDPFATDGERQARAGARASAWWTLGVGVVGVLTLVALLGRGRGATMISSGLKSLGKILGGGMAAGLFICSGAPLAAAAWSAKNTYVRLKDARTSSDSVT
jgi:hypothetical protein